MSFSIDVWKALFKMYLIHRKGDPKFNFIIFLKMLYVLLMKEKIVKYKNKYIVGSWLPPIPSKAMFTMINAVPIYNKKYTCHAYALKSAPTLMHLCVTSKCINNCKYCSVKNRKKGRELSTIEWKRVIGRLQDMGISYIVFTGGEPLLRKDIFDLIQYVDNRSKSCLFTTGYKLTEKVAYKLKRSGLFSVFVGIDIPSKTSDKKFKQALNAIKVLRKAGLYVGAQMVVLKEQLNKKKLFKFFKLLKKHGVYEIRILTPIISGNLINESNIDDIIFNEEENKKLYKIQHKANKKFCIPKISVYSYYESKEKYGCNAGIQNSYISESGDLFPCDFVPMSFGNVLDIDVSFLWKSMNEIINKPRSKCMAQKYNKQLINKNLPISKSMATDILLEDLFNYDYPKVYKIIQSK